MMQKIQRQVKSLKSHSFFAPFSSMNTRCRGLELSLGSLNGGNQEIPHLAGGLVNVVAHLVTTKTLRDDVEVEARATLKSAQRFLMQKNGGK